MLSCRLWISKVKSNDLSAGIYIHIPFCLRKCSYCDFYSLSRPEPAILERYCQSLIRELQDRAIVWQEHKFSTLYLGGGTPSLLNPAQIEQVVKAIFSNYNMEASPEISMEANPATLTGQSLQELQAAGINRISLGVQSFQDHELKLLGRMHGVEEVEATVLALDKAGIKNYNLDLIYGIPGQTLEDWMYNLRMAVQSHPQHISAYLLQLDPSTPLARWIQMEKLPEGDEDLEASMYYEGRDYLSSQGYQHYEISNFAQANQACRHNLIYWQAHEYLGLGAGAVSYKDGQRRLNQADLDAYLARIENGQPSEIEVLEVMSERDKLLDAIILGLRMTAGIKPSEFWLRFGIDFTKEYHAIISKLEQDGLLIVEKDRIYLSRRGYFLSNQVFCQFL